jgi:hypothetical protein
METPLGSLNSEMKGEALEKVDQLSRSSTAGFRFVKAREHRAEDVSLYIYGAMELVRRHKFLCPIPENCTIRILFYAFAGFSNR